MSTTTTTSSTTSPPSSLNGVLPPPTITSYTIELNDQTSATTEKTGGRGGGGGGGGGGTGGGGGGGRQRSGSKYKPPPKKSVTDGLQFAPFARHIVTANMYILFLLGVIDLAMTQRRKYLGPGIYAICVSFLIYIWHFISDFNTQEKMEDSIEANLEPRGWPKWICWPLTIFANYLIQCILCVCLSVYLCFSPQTVLGAFGFVAAAILYLVGFIRREKPKPITGIV